MSATARVGLIVDIAYAIVCPNLQEKLETANSRLADLHEAQVEDGGPDQLERELELVNDQVKQIKLKMAEYNVCQPSIASEPNLSRG